MRPFLGAACAALLVALLAGTSSAADPVVIKIAGSTTLQPLVEEAARAYAASHPDVTFVITGGGSRSGLDQLRDSSVDVAMTDTAPPSDSGLVDRNIAALTLAFIVNPDAGVSKLTTRQIRDIFSGGVTNWKSVGGNDRQIALLDRSPGLVVHAIFVRSFMDTTSVSQNAQYADSSVAALTQAGTTSGSISYVVTRGLAFTGVVPIALDGVAPTDENTMAGTYHFWTFEHFVTLRAPTLGVSRFFAFLETQRALMRKHGFIAVRDIK